MEKLLIQDLMERKCNNVDRPFILRVFIGDQEIYKNKTMIVTNDEFEWVYANVPSWQFCDKYDTVMIDVFYEYIRIMDCYGINKSLFDAASLEYRAILDGMKHNLLVMMRRTPIGCDTFFDRYQTTVDYLEYIFRLMQSYLSTIIFCDNEYVDKVNLTYQAYSAVCHEYVTKEMALEFINGSPELFQILSKLNDASDEYDIITEDNRTVIKSKDEGVC